MNLPDRRSLALLGVAIMAIASSAVLVRWAEAPAIALAFWRTLGGSLVLATRRRPADTRPRPSRATTLAIVGAGLALAVHFSSWLASLEMTSVAASVTLVSTAPIGVALLQWGAGGDRPDRRNWLVIAVTLLGVAVIAGGDIGTSSDELAGDALALLGAVAMAVYLVLGGRARTELSTTDYGARAYAVAAAALLPTALVTRTPLWGYDAQTWLVIAAMILGPQLAGHTVLNLLLEQLGSLTVSLALLAEPIGASVLTWLLFAETPPLAAWIGAPIVLTGLALHLLWASGQDVTTSRRAASSS
ncbi:MAG: DMT family transporter [Acidimicrobiales bacterium]